MQLTAEYKEQIMKCETQLLNAFMNKDLEAIDLLLHDDALFVYPNAMTVTKAMVLENYRNGNSAFDTICSTDQIINIIDDTAVVSMDLELKGKYHEEIISARFRYIRVWKRFDNGWKAIAVSGVPVSS
jgi:ketosteroid isomerase-like protein